MNDIRPPRRSQTSKPEVTSESEHSQTLLDSALADQDEAQSPPPSQKQMFPLTKRVWPKRLALGLLAVILVLAITVLAAWFWYGQQLKAVDPGSSQQVNVEIEAGSDPSDIAALLKQKDLIRSTTAFEWYVRLNGVAGSLQTGTYKIAKKADTPAIVKQMASGKVDTFTITFIPGHTLTEHRERLINAGYKPAEVDDALNKSYDHPLLKGKPASRDLEGYIFGETYQFSASATVEQILSHTFDIYYQTITDNDLEAKYKKLGLTLFEGITLASIIERESGEPGDVKQISQVFHLRLNRDMPLGSDPTYQYIADKTGVPRDPGLDSPYNTRVVKGLPPGPIASPGEGALVAAGSPAKGDFLYFVSGDDDKTYFSRTNEEHERNVREHCQQKCQIL